MALTGLALLVLSFVAGAAGLWLALRLFETFGAEAPNDRSNHKRPTPQIGGIAMVPVWLAAMLVLGLSGTAVPVFGEPGFLCATAMLAALGVVDDLKPLGPLPKLLGQVAACSLATVALSEVISAAPLPFAVSAALCVLFLVAIVNLTNFIDGLDLMMVATVGIPGATFAALAASGAVAAAYLPAGFACIGLFAAFAMFNWHPARTFLGDGGSLPFGLILGTMAVIAGFEAGPVLSLMLPAYILLDGGFTLARRLLRRENVLAAHSSHVYQRAFRSGRGVIAVSLGVAAFSVVSGALAVAVAGQGAWMQVAGLVAVATLWLGLAWWLPIRR